MNPMAAPSLLSLLPVAADPAKVQPGEGPEGADFGALLADLGSSGAPLPTPSVQMPFGAPLSADLAQADAPASPLPATGKILPGELPGALPGEVEAPALQPGTVKSVTLALAMPEDQSVSQQPEIARPVAPAPVVLLPHALAAIGRRAAPAALHEPETSAEVAPEEDRQAYSSQEVPVPPVFQTLAQSPLLQPAKVDPATETQPSTPTLRSEPRSAPTGQAVAALTQGPDQKPLPEVLVADSAARAAFAAVAPALVPRRTAVRVTIEPAPLASIAAPEAPLAPALAPIQHGIPAPVRPLEAQATVAAVEAKSAASDPAPSPRTEALLPDGQPAPALAIFDAPQQQSPAAQASPAIEPRDFTALLDRLVAAREAMRGEQTRVSLALPHAEFGQVRLDFRHDERGLSVSLASPDPAFARAASTALPLAQAAAPADAGTRQSSEGQPRGQADTQSFGQGAAQSRGGNQGGQNDRQTRSQTFVQPRAQPAAAPDRSGIFA